MSKTTEQITSTTSAPTTPKLTFDSARLRRLCLDAGADDVGFVEIDRKELAFGRCFPM